ncbi:MAG: alkaline phosphatase family protein [Deltaproteobacteria bacterium]|nr:alkaline phosphatase family protein [Deltaproteobacteria bacterium]
MRPRVQKQEDTVVDELKTLENLAAKDVAIVASWGPMAHAVTRHPCGAVISAGRTGGASRDAFRVNRRASEILRESSVAAAYPGWGDYRPDRFAAALALHYLREVAPRLLVVGLGDTDEYGHRGNYEKYVESLQRFDAFLGDLFRSLEHMRNRGGRTASVFVLTDHGRDAGFAHHGSGDPSSSRVWVLAHGPRIVGPARRAGRANPMSLGDLAPTLRTAFGLTTHGEGEGEGEGEAKKRERMRDQADRERWLKMEKPRG